MKILANDGISNTGKEMLENKGFEVNSVKVAQNQLRDYIKQHKIEGLIVRSTTTVDKEVMQANPDFKFVARAGVSLDTIDTLYARLKSIQVFNTPEASATSVAELTFAHLLSGVRQLYHANRNMPLEGEMLFNQLKKSYSGGTELRDKTLGIIGLGKIGREVAKIALGIGMKVIASDKEVDKADIELAFYNHQSIKIPITIEPVEDLIKHSDFISLHIPAQDKPLIGKREIDAMKPGVGIINTASGSLVDEDVLLEALETGKVGFAGLDVFAEEPKPAIKLLMNEKISLSPHIGGSTQEAQERISIELAKEIISRFKA